jgi:hypothetical protein
VYGERTTPNRGLSHDLRAAALIHRLVVGLDCLLDVAALTAVTVTVTPILVPSIASNVQRLLASTFASRPSGHVTDFAFA